MSGSRAAGCHSTLGPLTEFVSYLVEKLFNFYAEGKSNKGKKTVEHSVPTARFLTIHTENET